MDDYPDFMKKHMEKKISESIYYTKNTKNTITNINNNFNLKLYNQLKSNPGNIFYSPYSIVMALTMLYAGSDGNSKLQIEKAMGLSGNSTELYQSVKDLQDMVTESQTQNKFELSIANAFWIQNNLNIINDFNQILNKYFHSEIKKVDFRTQSEQIRVSINQWVEKITHDKIKDLFPRGSIINATRFVVVNAIYFKAEWDKPFKEKYTKPDNFYVNPGNTINIPFMKQQKNYRYMKNNHLEMIELYYKDYGASMYILLPVDKYGLASLESQITEENLNVWLEQLSSRLISLYMPKYKMEDSFELNKILLSLGISDVFSPQRSNLSGITKDIPLSVSAALHKAVIEVDEEGTVAAAATGIMGVSGALKMPEPIIVKVNHPFIFFIRYNKTGAVLFMGRVVNPGR
jgi:serpin B